MTTTDFSRRSFLKKCVVSGIAIYTAPLLWKMNQAKAGMIVPELKEQWHSEGQTRFRQDGIAKVTGKKVYGRDYRAEDLQGWPKQQGHAFILRATEADKRFTGIDLSRLKDNQPYKVITAADLAADKVAFPPFFGDQMLLEEGQTPHYLGHAVAILLFRDFASYQSAKRALRNSSDVIRFGEKTGFVSDNMNPYASWRIIRAEGDGPSGKDLYSPLQDGIFFPSYKANKEVWESMAKQSGSVSERGMYYAGQIAEESSASEYVLSHEYQTQSIDPMMMEAEAFNGWFDQDQQTLNCVLTSQSPQDVQEQAAHMLAKTRQGSAIKNLVIHAPYIGGGFGAKDHTTIPYYGMVAALYAEGPVRLANDRFEQFQAGIKRHPFIMRNRLAVDKKTLKIKSLIADMDVDGGGRVNFTPSVAMVGASAMQGIYYIPKNDLQVTAYPSRNPDCGSMRGYGSLQTMATMEMMMNEVAGDLNVDAIDLRVANVMESGQRTTQGAFPNGALRYKEMLKMASQHPLWKNRTERKAEFESKNPGKTYGVGYGITTKDYGTGAAAPSAVVSLKRDGTIELKIGFVEMGTGTQTSQSVVVGDVLGNIPVDTGVAEINIWDAMQLKETDSPYMISQQRQDEMAKDPRWTPVVSMASAASMSSFYQTHATKEAAQIIFDHGIWPSAVALWTKKYFNGDHAPIGFTRPDKAQWVDGKLNYAGYPPLTIAEISDHLHEHGMVCSAMVHAFNRWAWTESDFNINGETTRRPIDGLAIQYGEGASKAQHQLMAKTGFHLLDRSNVRYPDTALNNAMVTYYAPCATMAEVAVTKGSGEVELLSTHTWLDAGKVLVKELVEGQIEGGLVMGVGHVLHEYLPEFEACAGNGTWNLNRYQVPLARHSAVWKQSHTILPPLSDNDPNKGIAEVVMIPVVPAITEAIYQATEQRFYQLPITAKAIKKALS